MPFLNDLEVREVDSTTWELLGPIIYQGEFQQFTVPAGFKTDFASVPRVFIWLVPPYGLYTKAAILHDYLYVTKKVSRADADGIFRRSMRELGVSCLRRWLMWAAVRAFSRLSRANLRECLAWIAIALPATLFLAIPATVVLVWLAMFWVLEYILLAGLAPISKRHAPKPHFLLGADATKPRK